MSVQFGIWNFEGQPPAQEYIENVGATLAPYGPDSNESYSKGGLKILYRAFHTTKESRREKQPYVSPSGGVITWDGRLDNRADLIGKLRDSVTVNSTDVAVVAAAYEKWSTNCLRQLIGDWALSIWNPINQSLILAKDPIGTRHLFYSIENNQVTWSTILDPLVLFAAKTFSICEEYIAGWFSYFPAAHLTPYIGIHSVPPSSSALIQPGKHIVSSKYWDFDPGKRVRYRMDAEYEEQFRSFLATAVQRRLRSDRPVLAELSGGMDSSSIVCMADTVIARGTADTPRLDTISWYDDSYDHLEPDWNERPYFTKVEEKRGRTGCQINLGSLGKAASLQRLFASEFDNDRLVATPYRNGKLSEYFKHYAAYMRSQGHRVTLSGIGGDEATGGGVPIPTPELQNLLVRARFFTLARQLKAWAVKLRKPRLLLLWEAARGFLTPSLVGVSAPAGRHAAFWLHSSFVRGNDAAFCGYPSKVRLLGPLPSFQENIVTLDVIRRLLAASPLQLELPREVRFPYLDRDLLEFLYAIPREQIVRVGQRRSLMKRALVGIVPDELLHRRRKAFVPPDLRKESSTEWPSLVEVGRCIVGSSVKLIDPDRFLEALQKARGNEEVPIDMFRSTLTLESWLRHLTVQGVLTNSISTNRQGYSSALEAQDLRSSAQPHGSAS